MNHIYKLRHFVKPYLKWSLLSLALLTAVVIMDLAIPRLIQRIIDQGIGQRNPQVVLQTTLWMLGISVLSTLFAVGNNIFSVRVGESVARDLREALFLSIQSFSFGNLDRLNTGQLMVRLSSDASIFQRLVQVFLRIGTRAPLLMIGSLILMFNTDQKLALTILPLLLFTSGVIVFFVSKMGPFFRSVQEKLDRLNTVLQENIAGVRVVKAFVRADHESSRFATANEAYTEHNIRVMQFMSSMSPILSILVNFGIVVVIWSGGLQSIRAEVSIGQIVAFTNYLQTTMGPLTIMVMLSNILAAATVSAERINEVLDTVPEVQDAPDAIAIPALTRPEIVFENVRFHYRSNGNGDIWNGASDDEPSVLEGVNLTAQPGETVAILGATGSGKTTLVNLIPRFYDASSGRVLINGIDIRRIKQDSLLPQIGIVPQETILFTGTVRENIRYGNPQANDESVIAAAQAAQAHDFILQLPQGYDTRIEERGVNLSGGQKQRIAIARALLTHPAILILDDSTSSVDVETETKIQAALESGVLYRNWQHDRRDAVFFTEPAAPLRTSFIVAQRISTVLNADKIVVIDQGQIAAEGTHSQLMQSSPIYQEIVASQLGNGVRITSP